MRKVMRTFKIYNLSNFQIAKIWNFPVHQIYKFSNTAVLLVIVLCITSPGILTFITGSLYLLTTFTYFSHSQLPVSGNSQSLLCIYELQVLLVLFVFIVSAYKLKRAVFVFSVWCISLAQCPQDQCMLLQIASFPSFYKVSNISLCGLPRWH